jgi:hypothetical protein
MGSLMDSENFESLLEYFINKIEELSNKVGKQTENIRTLTLERNEARVELNSIKSKMQCDKPVKVTIGKS